MASHHDREPSRGGPEARPELRVARPDESTPADETTMARGWLTHLRESAIFKLEDLDVICAVLDCPIGDDALRTGLAEATAAHLPSWADKLTPHVMRHFCASELYLSGLDLISIQELLGHSWVASTLNYVHVHRTRIDDAWIAGQQRAAGRLGGLLTWSGTCDWPSPTATSGTSQLQGMLA